MCAGGGTGAGGLWASADDLLTVLSAHDGELARQWRALLHDSNGMSADPVYTTHNKPPLRKKGVKWLVTEKQNGA